MPGGRPSSYSPEIADAICEELANGAVLYRICKERDDFPDTRTVYRWMEANEEFRRKYARARERQAEYFADQIITISDTATDAQLARLQVDARKWHASKTAPKRYGDRVMQEHDLTDKAAEAMKPADPNDVARSIAFILAKAAAQSS